MIANLTWDPAAGGGTQTIQFKVSGQGTWSTYTTVAPTVNNLAVTGLDYNTLYFFEVINNCPSGAQPSSVGFEIVIQCPNVLITPSDTVANIQFFHLGGTIDTYVVNLLDLSNNVLQTKTLVAPFNPMVVTSFTGLTALTTYNIQISPASATHAKNDCPVTTFKTTNTPTCPAPVGLIVNFS